MVAVALIASGLGLLLARDGADWRFGELTPFSAIGLVGLAMALLASGRLRRFFAGLTVTGVVVGLAFWVGPHSFRSYVLDRVLFPIDARIAPRTAGMGMTHLQVSLTLWIIETPETRRIRPTRSPFWSRESQEELGLLELAIAVVGGLLAAIPRPPRLGGTSTPSIDPS